MAALETMWNEATPLNEILEKYEARYAELVKPNVRPPKPKGHKVGAELFWIDVGYVTKNRGAEKPGNQFDLPKGAHVFLGVKKIKNPALNSVLANLNIRTAAGKIVERPIRFGNNSMEKLTLPIPEQSGYECYDGKILVFKVEGDTVLLQAFEHEDFFQVYGKRIGSCRQMQSGRLFGTASLP